jgi:hypothetical protein
LKATETLGHPRKMPISSAFFLDGTLKIVALRGSP